VALHYIAIAKSGKPVPASLPADIVPPSYRKQQKLQTSESPAEKQPASLPRPTSRPPAGVTKVPAIQPPSSNTAKPQPQAALPSAEPAAPAGAVDPFGMKPAMFEAAAGPAEPPVTDATMEAGATDQSNVSRVTSPPTDVAPSSVEPVSAATSEGVSCSLPYLTLQFHFQ